MLIASPARVDRRQVRRAGVVARRVGRVEPALAIGRVARRGRLDRRSRLRDQLRPPGDVAGVEQALHRHVDEFGIGQVFRAVGIGQPRGLGEQVPEPRPVQHQLVRLEAVEQHQDLAHRRRARRRRPHAAHPVLAERVADGRPLGGAIAGQVLGAQRAGPRLLGDGQRDLVGDHAGVEGVGPLLGQRLQRARQRRLAQRVALGQRHAARQEDQRRVGVRQPAGDACDRLGQPGRDREAFLGKLDGRLEQARPGQLAMTLVQRRQQPHQPGRADRAARGDGGQEGQGLAVLEEHVGRGARRRRLARVPARHAALGLRVGDQREGAAAQPARLRLDDVQRQQRRDRRVGRAPAGLEHRQPGLRRRRVRGDDHVLAGGRQRLRLDGRCGLGIGPRLGGGGQRGQHQAGGQEKAHAASLRVVPEPRGHPAMPRPA